MRAARDAVGLTQEGLAQAVGGSKPGIRDNEGGKNVPGGKVICGLINLGINANWLLTGEGPMLLKDLQEVPAPAPRINIDALVQAFCVSVATAPKGETMEQSARKAVQFYLYCLDQGLITPEGLGTGIDGKAA